VWNRPCKAKRALWQTGSFFGGVCNTQILPRGDKREIEKMVVPLIELGKDGGLIIGSATIGDDIDLKFMIITLAYLINMGITNYSHSKNSIIRCQKILINS